jgi:hypothetical protein
VQSILNGTWGNSQPAPPQWNDFLLMKQMRWSWEELQQTPMYVRGFCHDFLGEIADAEEAARKKSERRAAMDARR